MAIHNAKDGREKWERQGIIDQDKPWCLVYEDVPDGDLRVPLFPQNTQGLVTPGTGHSPEEGADSRRHQ